MKQTWIRMAALLVAGMAVGMTGQHLRSADAKPPPDGPSVETNVPVTYSEDEQGRLRAEVHVLSEQVQALARSKREASAAPSAPAAPPQRRTANSAAIAREDAIAEGEAQQEAQERAIAEQFANEPSDPRWDAIGSVTSKLKKALPPGSTLQHVECRSTLCRIDTTHLNREGYSAYTDGYMLSSEHQPEERIWEGTARFVLHGDHDGPGPVSSTVFLLRDGHEFPDVQ